mmetsp:Transcript_23142/g.64685  ORF Transcript_23142/g.64685 Transcript_23142/m.64685 type:complete len:208 (-) Transcript_23142:186-809(-)
MQSMNPQCLGKSKLLIIPGNRPSGSMSGGGGPFATGGSLGASVGTWPGPCISIGGPTPLPPWAPMLRLEPPRFEATGEPEGAVVAAVVVVAADATTASVPGAGAGPAAPTTATPVAVDSGSCPISAGAGSSSCACGLPSRPSVTTKLTRSPTLKLPTCLLLRKMWRPPKCSETSGQKMKPNFFWLSNFLIVPMKRCGMLLGPPAQPC